MRKIWFGVCLLLIGCSPGELATATVPAVQADVPITRAASTSTALPTATSIPPTPTPTLPNTATPTPTPLPTATPVPDPNTIGGFCDDQGCNGDRQTRSTDGMVMVYVPVGHFIMGSQAGDNAADDDEFPAHEVTLDGFWLDRTEVTNDQFAEFVAATGYVTSAEETGSGYIDVNGKWESVSGADWQHPQGSESNLSGLSDHPVVMISWVDAGAYCNWAGGRLPTEAEWEYAARGPEGRIYPWGDVFDGSLLNFCDENCPYDWRRDANDGYEFTAPVGSYPDGASWVDALDMVGNVWEWVNDWFGSDYYANSPTMNPIGPEDGLQKVVRGGAWTLDPRHVRSAYRGRNALDFPIGFNGFRCAVSPSGVHGG